MNNQTNDKNFLNFKQFILDLKRKENNIGVKYGKSDKILSWIGIYTEYLKLEEEFNPKQLINYNKGDIVFVNLGYNVGNEEGGVHFAVVLDDDNDQKSGIVTVIPLSSIKNGKVNEKYEVKIENGIYELMYNKSKSLGKMNELLMEVIERVLITLNEELNNKKLFTKNNNTCLKERINKCMDEIIELDKNNELSDTIKKNFIEEEKNIDIKDIEKMIYLTELQVKQLKKNINCLDKLNGFIYRAKDGTKALVSQITTISKLRIIDPKKDFSPLSKVKLSEGDLENIQKKIGELFLNYIDK